MIDKRKNTANINSLGFLCVYTFNGRVNEAIEKFKKFPFKNMLYSQKNLGHPMHFLCSYQSKMKPSMAYFLVKYFTQLYFRSNRKEGS
jgi:hypothetical protein